MFVNRTPMPNYICVTCGTQHPDSILPAEHCVLCSEERQYIGWDGQLWTTMEELRASHRNQLKPEGPGLVGIGSDPVFAIGQRALYLKTASGGF
ncbi:MAG: MBL fold metallo-hydrolase, partial [Gemmatimonadales bacterium]